MTELAFVVCFATLFIKIWRLYRVFFNKQMLQRVSISAAPYSNNYVYHTLIRNI